MSTNGQAVQPWVLTGQKMEEAIDSPLTPAKVRRNSMKPSMRSPSSAPSPLGLPRRDPVEPSRLRLPFFGWKAGGRGEFEDWNDDVEVEAHRWFRRIDEVNVWISCWRSVTGERSVRDILTTVSRCTTSLYFRYRWLPATELYYGCYISCEDR